MRNYCEAFYKGVTFSIHFKGYYLNNRFHIRWRKFCFNLERIDVNILVYISACVTETSVVHRQNTRKIIQAFKTNYVRYDKGYKWDDLVEIGDITKKIV